MYHHTINQQTHLKLLTLSDSEEFFQLIDKNREHLRSWLPWVDHHTTEEHSLDYIYQSMQKYMLKNGLQAGIFFKEKLIGVISLHFIDWINKTTAIGYWLSRDFEGMGFMTESCKAILHHVFEELKLNRVEIRVGTQNLRSQSIPKRLGFKNEGCIHQAEWIEDQYIDHFIYGMVSKDWKKLTDSQ